MGMQPDKSEVYAALVLDELQKARLEARLTQAEVAARVGKNHLWVSRVEGGRKRVDVNELRLLVTAMGLSFLEFVRRVEKRVSDDIL